MQICKIEVSLFNGFILNPTRISKYSIKILANEGILFSFKGKPDCSLCILCSALCLARLCNWLKMPYLAGVGIKQSVAQGAIWTNVGTRRYIWRLNQSNVEAIWAAFKCYLKVVFWACRIWLWVSLDWG